MFLSGSHYSLSLAFYFILCNEWLLGSLVVLSTSKFTIRIPLPLQLQSPPYSHCRLRTSLRPFHMPFHQLLPGILTALQNNSMVGNADVAWTSGCTTVTVTPPPSPFTSLFFLSNITVPSFIISTHSTLGNSSLSNPSTVLQEDCYNFVHVVVGTHHSLSLTYPPLLCCHLGLLSLQLWLFLC